jgi:hypothetical protein
MDYVGLFQWLANKFPDHPLDYRILLNRFEHLPLRADHGLDPALLATLRQSWKPLSVLAEGGDADDDVIWRLRGTALVGTGVFTVEFDLTAGGDVRSREVRALGEDLPLDTECLGALLALPALGPSGGRRPTVEAGTVPSEELE